MSKINDIKELLIIFIVAIGSSLTICGQVNLIPNGDFEKLSNCPQEPGNLTGFVNEWRSFHYQPSYNNYCGYREPWNVIPFEGNGMVSIVLFTNRFNVHWRYIHNRLKTPLKPNRLYYFEFMHFVRWAGYQIKKYQVHFTHDWYTDPYPEGQLFIELDPQFETSQEEWAPFDEWTRRSGCFSVDEPFQYMMFGNFNGTNTDTFTYREDALQAYIQFDNFALFEVEQLKHDDLSLCPSEEYTLPYFELTGLTYILEGDTLGIDLPLLAPGEYYVDQHLDGCGLFHTFKVEVGPCTVPCRTVPEDKRICAFEPIILPDDYSYFMNSDSIENGQYFSVGLFQIEVSDSICGIFSEFMLEVLPCEECLDISWEDSSICVGDEFDLPQYEELVDLRYIYEGDTVNSRSIIMNNPGLHEILVTSEICDLEWPMLIQIDDCKACPIYIPTAFSPNGDGVNDELVVFTDCQWIELEIRVFDRWGSLLYISGDSQTWDGSFRGQLLDEGVYIYELRGKMRDGQGEKEIKKSGDVMLFR